MLLFLLSFFFFFGCNCSSVLALVLPNADRMKFSNPIGGPRGPYNSLTFILSYLFH